MNRIEPGTTPTRRTDRYTYRDYRGWPEEERWELINGVAFDMSPAPRRAHQRVLAKLYVQMDGFFAGEPCKPHIAPVDVLFAEAGEVEDEVRTVVQPDAFVVCDAEKLTTDGVHGAPDFVIEVLSPGTAMKDQSEKRRLYENHQVAEYWIVNPDTFEVLVYRLKGEGSYGLPTACDLRAGVPVARFPGLTLTVRPEDL